MRLTAASSNKERGAWSGVGIYDQSDDTQTSITYTTIEYAGATEAALFIDSAHPLLDHVTIRESKKSGLRLSDGALKTGSTALTLTSNAEYGAEVSVDSAASLPEVDSSYAGNVAGAVAIRGGSMENSAAWGDIGAPYLVLGDLHVEGASRPKLTLEAGVELRCVSSAGLYFSYYGQPSGFAVTGTPSKPVKLRSERATEAGAWSGVQISDLASDTDLSIENAEISFGGGALDGCLLVDAAKVVMKSVNIHDCKNYGLVLMHGATLGANSTGLSVSASERGGVRVEPSGVGSLPKTGSSYLGNPSNIGVEIVEGPLEGNATWPALNAPYVVSGDIHVGGPGRPVLTIEPGSTLRFRGDAGLYVSNYGTPGGIVARGTAEAPITFTGHDQQTPGAWSGISLSDMSLDTSVFEHVTIEWAGRIGANLVIDYVRATLTDVMTRGSSTCGLKQMCASPSEAPVVTGLSFGTGPEANQDDLCNDSC